MLRRLALTSKRALSSPAPASQNAKRRYVVDHKNASKSDISGFQGALSIKLAAARKVIKYTIVGGISIGLVVVGSLELTHQYIEYGAMRPEVDEEIKKFQWDISGELWQGRPSVGGTDPGLGRPGRQAVRSAWHAVNWSIGNAQLPTGTEHLGIGPDEIPTFYAIQFLQAALAVAENKKEYCDPLTLPVLHYRIASLCERLGGPFSPQAKSHFEQAWQGYSGQSLNAAQTALKLGDINFRLQQNDEARKWWGRAIQLSSESPTDLLVPTSVPPTPWGQRIVASTLVSLSAFYAQTGRLADAEKFEQSSLSFLRSIPTPDSISHASPSQTLHAFFLLQRSSLLSVHLAEVLNAQNKSLASSIQYLTFAAESSERLARALAGLPLHEAYETPEEALIPHGGDKISPAFFSSPILRPVARGLYHDAKRTSAEAWNLLGVLYEQREGRSSEAALHCYERAVKWAGGESETANGSTTENGWRVFNSNLQKARESSAQESK